MRRSLDWYAWDDIDWDETYYDTRRHTIVYGNMNSGDTQAWGGVTDEIVKKVAASSGRFKEFGQSGCENNLP